MQSPRSRVVERQGQRAIRIAEHVQRNRGCRRALGSRDGAAGTAFAFPVLYVLWFGGVGLRRCAIALIGKIAQVNPVALGDPLKVGQSALVRTLAVLVAFDERDSYQHSDPDCLFDPRLWLVRWGKALRDSDTLERRTSCRDRR
jgi:hypothetical protein